MTEKCLNCGNPAETHTPVGAPACRQCFNDGKPLAVVLDELAAFVGRFIVFTTPEQLTAVVLWAAHTYMVQRLRTTPYLHISSPEPASGKSQLLDVLELVVFQPWMAVLPSQAILYRKIDSAQGSGGLTLLLDEIDPVFKRGGGEDAEGLRAVLNSGYQKGRSVPRCVGPTQKLVDFQVFGAKALAGLGDIPDTVASRSIRIAMKKRKPSESVEPLFPDELVDEVEDLKEMLMVEATAVPLTYLKEVRRELLSLGLGDRAADLWSGLVVIADEAGGHWMNDARLAAVSLSTGRGPDDSSLGVKLLSDTRSVLAGWEHSAIFSQDLIDRLVKLDESPWADFYGAPVTPRKLATLFRGYDITSKQVRVGQETRKGYLLDHLQDAFDRYLPIQSETSETNQLVVDEIADFKAKQNENVSLRKTPKASMDTGDVSDVSLEMQETGGGPPPVGVPPHEKVTSVTESGDPLQPRLIQPAHEPFRCRESRGEI